MMTNNLFVFYLDKLFLLKNPRRPLRLDLRTSTPQELKSPQCLHSGRGEQSGRSGMKIILSQVGAGLGRPEIALDSAVFSLV